jgi:hypothetical protein
MAACAGSGKGGLVVSQWRTNIAAVERLGPAITPDSLRRFALAARRKLRNEDGAYRRDHLRALAQRVEVVDPPRFASWDRKPNCYGHLLPLRA